MLEALRRKYRQVRRKLRKRRGERRMAKRYRTNTNTRGPDFLIIGTQKGGTTALAFFLTKHPEVCMGGPRKELHYFDEVEPGPIEEYHRHFLPMPRHKIIGEATPSYMYMPEAIPRIHAYNPKIKLIVLLRDPITRAYSNWNMVIQRTGDPPEFDVSKLRRIHERGRPKNYADILGRSLYHAQLKRVFDHFPREQVLMLGSDELKTAHDATMEKVAAFLGIKDFPKIPAKEKHVRKYERPLTEKEYRELKEYFKEDVALVARDFGVDTSSWMTKY